MRSYSYCNKHSANYSNASWDFSLPTNFILESKPHPHKQMTIFQWNILTAMRHIFSNDDIISVAIYRLKFQQREPTKFQLRLLLYCTAQMAYNNRRYAHIKDYGPFVVHSISVGLSHGQVTSYNSRFSNSTEGVQERSSQSWWKSQKKKLTMEDVAKCIQMVVPCRRKRALMAQG